MPKLIVRAPNHLGDSVMALSAIGALRDLFQDSEINIISPEFVAGLFKRHPSVDSVLSLKDGTQHGFKSISATRDLLRDSGDDFEIGILLTDSLSAATAFKFAGVTHIYGYSGSGKALALSASLTASKAVIHRSERYQNLVSFAALRFWENPYWVQDVKFEEPEFYFSDIERAAAKTILERAGVIETSSDTVSESGAFVALAPQAVAESRRWGVEKYGELAKRIVTELDLGVALIGSHADHEAGEAVRLNGGGERIVNLCGGSRIRGAAALLECASAFVGNDSGLAHLAALVDLPLVVLSGADNPAETSPISVNKIIVERAELNCIHCIKNTCRLSGEDHMNCMRLITVEEVYGQLKSLLEQ